MLHAHLWKSLRLNRLIGLSVLFYMALLTFVAPIELHLGRITVTVLLGSTLCYMGINEWFAFRLRQFTDHDRSHIDTWSILMPLGLFLYTVLAYGMTGHWVMFSFALFPILQAHLFGHGILARFLLLAAVVVLGVSVPIGYPRHLGNHHLYEFFVALPFMLTLFQFGVIVKSLVKATSSQMFRLQSLAATDGLTGIINRRQFNHQLHGEVARAIRHRTPISLALFDIDDFKKLNDVYGHPVGDQILRELGALIAKNVRECDIPAPIWRGGIRLNSTGNPSGGRVRDFRTAAPSGGANRVLFTR